jgi:hypothetical protein
MLTRLRKRLSYANVIASLALFIALGGVSYAATIAPKNSVRSSSIKNGQVKTADLANNAVTSAKIKNGQVAAADMATSLRADLNDAATLNGKSAAAIQAGTSDVRQALGTRTFSGTSPSSTLNTVTLPLPAGTWLLHFGGHAIAGASSPAEHMSVTYGSFVGSTALGSESVTLTTDFNIIFVDVGAKDWHRDVLVNLATPQSVTLRTNAVANGGDWTGGGRSLQVDRANIVAEKVLTADGATPIP